MRYAIIGHTRTGSNWLHDLVSKHSMVTGYGEAVHPSKYKNISGRKKGFVKVSDLKFLLKESENIFIFKYFYQHQDTRVDTFLKKENFRFIHLMRDPIDIFISQCLVEINGLQWEGNYVEEEFFIDIPELKRFLQRFEAYQQEVINRFDGMEILGVEYRHLCNQLKNQLGRVFRFLNIPYEQVKSSMKRQRTKERKDTVVNYKEVIAELKSSGYERYIND